MTDHKVPRIKVGISLRVDVHQALRERAELERHGNVSLIVQRAIDRELGLTNKTVDEQDAKERVAA